ncbi:hypothetical protein CVT25_011766 [Psilocybe cyanescens]|uniref:Uncharacterized protein n=1 Tax=Psilocybe cyanescens TaxID=93625 RepID=A0A409VV98_PSICY|nr:hypothetical protein CVT25_011766 [Psilocybe cyanescens]
MFASRFFVSLLAFTALGVSASPAPAPAEKRSADVSDVLAVVSTLKTKTNAILPEINALVAQGFANQATLTPLLTNLVASLNTAHTSIAAISSVNADSGSTSDVANAIAPIVADITNTLGNAQTAVPGLAGIIAGFGLDAALNQILVGLEILLAGVLNLVAGFALAVSANPAPLEKRASDALGVVNTLQVNTAAVLPEINSLVASGFANANTIAPLVTSLVDHLNTAHTSLTAIKAVDSSAVSTPDVANAMAPITAVSSSGLKPDITTTLHSAQSSVPGLAELLEDLGLDASLNQVLVGLDNIVAGVLNLVSKLAFAVFAHPVDTEKRQSDNAEIMGAISNLQSKTTSILPEINSLVASGIANADTISPLVSALVKSLNTAHTSISAISAVDTSAVSAPDVANAIGPIASDITTTLHNAQIAIPGLADVLEDLGLDAALNQVLVGLDNLIAGVLNIVSKL